MFMSQEYLQKQTSISLINYHFVWIPCRRKKILTGLLKERLLELLYQKSTQLNCNILEVEIMIDHVHLFLNCPPSIAPQQIMFRLKGFTSRVLRAEFPELMRLPSLWTRSYFVGSAGNVSSETIKRYIQE